MVVRENSEMKRASELVHRALCVMKSEYVKFEQTGHTAQAYLLSKVIEQT